MLEFDGVHKVVGDGVNATRHIESEILVESSKLGLDAVIEIAESVMQEVARLNLGGSIRYILLDVRNRKSGKIIYSIFTDLGNGTQSIMQELMREFRLAEAEEILGCKITPVNSDGYDLLEKMKGE